jgi:ABC-type antimicrobial peptide transport system permease subunit
MLTCPNRTGKRLGRGSIRRLAAVSALFIFLIGAVSGALTAEEKAQQEAAKRRKTDWPAIYPAIQAADLQRHIGYLENLGSRVAGYPGNAAAAEYIARQFKEIGLKDVSHPLTTELSGAPRRYREEFKISTPIVHSAGLQLAGDTRRYRLYPLWPNLVRTSKLPKAGLELPLLYGGKARLADFSGQSVAGAAVLLDFDTGGDWQNAVRLGAAAVIFIAPPEDASRSLRVEGENKLFSIPVDIPRFWLPRQDGLALLKQIQSQGKAKVHLDCDMTWETRPCWNLIGEIPGADPKLRSEVIYLEAYYDSMSLTPELAPGAEAASGVAALLEIARTLKAHPPARTVRFLATGAHFVGLTGIRNYLGQHFDDLSQGEPYRRPAKFLGLIPYTQTLYNKQNINLFCALDLSSRSPQVGSFFKGNFYDVSGTNFKKTYKDIGGFFQDTAAALSALIPETTDRYVDTIGAESAGFWKSQVFSDVALDSEAPALGGSNSLGFLTCNDARPLVDTPFDRSATMNLSNLVAQTRFLACLFHETAVNPAAPISAEPFFSRANILGGFGRVNGRSLIFEAKDGIVPIRSVPGSLVVLRASSPAMCGVRANLVELAGPKGEYDFEGVPHVLSYGDKPDWKMVNLESYHLDPDTGSVDYALDRGSSQGRSYPNNFYMTSGEVERPLIIFPCYALTLLDLIDPQNLSSLSTLTVMDGMTDAEPTSFGFVRPSTISDPKAGRAPRVENVGIVFAQRPDKLLKTSRFQGLSRVKVLVSAGVGGVRMILLNAATVDKAHATGLGYLADHSQTIFNTALVTARDMWALDEGRIAVFRRFHIINKNVQELHDAAGKYISQAEQALARKDYAAMEAKAFTAWGYESKAYPAVQATNDDVVKAVIFYLALMLPFSFFMERLVLAARDFIRQILGFLGIFVVTVAIFSRIHPAFRISSNPLIVPLAFIMLSLSVLVISIVASKFETQLRLMREQMGGVHRADIGRMGVASAAFNLGISNMRKRKARTLFTCLTLVALTFTVLSFTSVSSSTRYTTSTESGKPGYQGIMLRDLAWEKLEAPTLRILQEQLGDYPFAPRAWYFNTRDYEEDPPAVVLTGADGKQSITLKTLVGMTAEESLTSGLNRALSAGRWFRPEDYLACILPEAVAKDFKISPARVGAAKVMIAGQPFTVIGIFNDKRAGAISDLDQEPLTPINYTELQQAGKIGASQAFKRFQHFSFEETAFITFPAAQDLGAPIQSIAIRFPNGKIVDETLREMLKRFSFTIYAGQDNHIYKWSALVSTSLSGMQDLVIPILIVALIILNTMLGSVYERIKEIHIYSSIGLGPQHIGILFIAEAFVYAVLGAIFGYLIGQSFAMIITRHFPGLELNYSSLSAVASTAVVIAVVLLSALYPARKASEVATPAVDRHWQLPDPEGDKWIIPLPFAVTGAQAAAMNSFLIEWFQAFEGHSIGDFVTENVQFREEPGAQGKSYSLSMKTWLAPFDLGVSQLAELRTLPTDMEDVFEIKFILTRESGDNASWKRVNRTFLNTIRKQFLIWRALSAKDRDRYLGRGDAAPAPEANPR